MRKIGIGSAQAVWQCYANFHKNAFSSEGTVFEQIAVFPLLLISIPIIIILFFIVDLPVVFFSWLIDVFNPKSDDNARDFVNSKSCPQINDLKDEEIKNLINLMLDGNCGDDDEKAILKLLDCLDCERRGNVVHLVGLDRLNYKIDGSEYDEFQILLGTCNLISFDNWSGDISQQFINRNKNNLNNLSAKALSDLLWNLIDGYTPDSQANAIFILARSVDCDKLRQIFRMYGNMRQAIFDETSKGSANRHEWEDILSRCNI